jgi:Dockerin type I domain/PEP-CTERM motif
MFRRIPFALMVASAIVVAIMSNQQASALDDLFQGDISTDWNTAGNWWAVGATSGFVPQESATLHLLAVIGSDDTDNGLNILNQSAVISAQLPAAKSVIGGITLGERERNYTVNPVVFYNPAPAAGALVGSLTISAGTLTSQSTLQATSGADGRILVGHDGRGFLTMTGGELIGPTIIVAGENYTGDALGTSRLDLSGSSKLTVSGVAQFSRRLRITGPNVNFSAGTQVRLDGTNTYTAAITSATAHSPLKTTADLSTATIAGTLNVEFSGAAATRDPVASLGTTWDLVQVHNVADNAITGTFSNEGSGRSIAVAGLDAAHSAPLGATYRLKQTVAGTETKLQLSYEQVLVLTVNRDTGEMSIRNPQAGHIAIDAYSVSSARGSMLAGYTGLGSSTPNAGVWVKPTAPGGNNANALSEVKQPASVPPIGNQDAYDLFPVPSVSLGTGFSRTAVGAGGANFGLDGEDLIFEYGGPATGDAPIRGQIEYIGTKFENDIVLRVNPTTGQAFIKNDTLVPRTIDGYSILSSTGNLDGAGFTGLGAGAGWQTSSPPTANAITQTNLTGSTTLAAGAQMAIGDISATGFLTDATKNGLSLQFAIANGGAAAGDYNSDGVVNAADYTVWRDRLNTAGTLPNQNPAALTPNTIDQEDYLFWKTNFGHVGGGEATFRVGSVVFDAAAGSGGGGLAGGAVPEPTAALLMFLGLGSIGLVRRKSHRSPARSTHDAAENHLILDGTRGATMSKRFGALLTAVGSLGIVLFAAISANAVTQGIPLTNGDMELPGPVGTKTVAFDATGVPIAGIIPGWTFTGGSGDAAKGEPNVGVGNSLFGDMVPGDSGVEGGGSPGNEMILSTLDGKAFQTSPFSLSGSPPFPTTQKLRVSFDARNIFTPIGACQLTARLYYVDASSVKQTIGTPLVMSALSGTSTNFAIEFRGDVPADMALLTPALNHPLGIEFDTTSYESDMTVDHLESWAGIDDVLMQITGVKRGDLNGDGSINATDYAVLRDNLQKTRVYEFEGELTGDGFVNLDDFRAFKNLFAAGGSGSIDFSGVGVPEPSTFALLLISALLAGCVRRSSRATSRRLNALLLAVMALVVLSAGAPESKATVLAHDPFLIGPTAANGQYVVTTTSMDMPPVVSNPLAGQNPTIGPAPSFFRDPWTIGAAGGAVQATSISYRGAATEGGSVTGYGRTERYLTTPFTAATEGTYYISALMNFGTTPNGAMGYRAMEFFPPDVVPAENRVGDIGYNQFFSAFGATQQAAATAKMQFNFNVAAQQIIQPSPDNYLQDGITHLLVLKFVMSATDASDSISLYFDPKTKIEPSAPTNLITGVNFLLGSIGFASFDNDAHGGTTVMDDIRVGTTFIDVVPPDLPVPGDTNGDEKIDLIDYQAIISHMNQPGGRTLAEGDVDGDGRVTIADYRFWKSRRTDLTAGSASIATGVPEPSTAAMLIAIVILAAAIRR